MLEVIACIDRLSLLLALLMRLLAACAPRPIFIRCLTRVERLTATVIRTTLADQNIPCPALTDRDLIAWFTGRAPARAGPDAEPIQPRQSLVARRPLRGHMLVARTPNKRPLRFGRFTAHARAPPPHTIAIAA